MHAQSAPFTDPGRKGSKGWSRVFEDAVRNVKAKKKKNNNNNKSDGRALTERKKNERRKAGRPENAGSESMAKRQGKILNISGA